MEYLCEVPLRKVVKTKLFLSTCYGDSSATDVPIWYEAASKNEFILYTGFTAVKFTIVRVQRNIFKATKIPEGDTVLK